MFWKCFSEKFLEILTKALCGSSTIEHFIALLCLRRGNTPYLCYGYPLREKCPDSEFFLRIWTLFTLWPFILYTSEAYYRPSQISMNQIFNKNKDQLLVVSHIRQRAVSIIWEKVFKNGTKKICRRHSWTFCLIDAWQGPRRASACGLLFCLSYLLLSI